MSEGLVIRASAHGEIREMLFYCAFPGVNIGTASQDCVAQAARFKTRIEFRFNGTRFMVDHTWSARRIAEEWCRRRESDQSSREKE